jgi:hypothetical protein
MADAPKKEPKKFRYADLDTLKRDRPYFSHLHQLKAEEKAVRFSNPAEPNYEKRIVTVRLAGFAPGDGDAKCHQDIAPVLEMAFEEIASLGLDYELRRLGDQRIVASSAVSPSPKRICRTSENRSYVNYTHLHGQTIPLPKHRGVCCPGLG